MQLIKRHTNLQVGVGWKRRGKRELSPGSNEEGKCPCLRTTRTQIPPNKTTGFNHDNHLSTREWWQSFEHTWVIYWRKCPTRKLHLKRRHSRRNSSQNCVPALPDQEEVDGLLNINILTNNRKITCIRQPIIFFSTNWMSWLMQERYRYLVTTLKLTFLKL